MNEIIFVLLAMILIIAFQAVQINKLEKAYKDYSNKQLELAKAVYKLLAYKKEDDKIMDVVSQEVTNLERKVKDLQKQIN